MDGRPNCRNKAAFSNFSGAWWTGEFKYFVIPPNSKIEKIAKELFASRRLAAVSRSTT